MLMITKVIAGLAMISGWPDFAPSAFGNAGGLTTMSHSMLASNQDASSNPPETTAATAKPSPLAAEAVVNDEFVDDIYAPRKRARPYFLGGGPNEKGYQLSRTSGDINVQLLPSARPLEEFQAYVSNDELILWRAAMGVTDDFTLEVSSMWFFSLGLSGKYALVRKNNRALSIEVGAAALTGNKGKNVEHLAALYSRDYKRGAYHLGAYGILLNENGRMRLIPELTAAGEIKLLPRVTGILEAGFGSELLEGIVLEDNTGFISAGVRIHGDQWFANLALISPLSEVFLKSDALGIPFVRIGKTF